jgi:DNA-binding NarL/FixJ family response regulator
MQHHVLIVDPKQGFGGLIRDALQSMPGVQATLAASEAEALAALRDEDISLVIVDFSSADLDAGALIARLQQSAPNLAVIGLPQEEAQEACREIGLTLDGFLPLPFYLPDVAQLAAKILGIPLNAHDLLPDKLTEGGPSEPSSETAPAWMQDVAGAQAQLSRFFSETSARAAMLTLTSGESAICGDLSLEQMTNLLAMMGHQASGKSARGALAQYVDLPATSESHLLFSTVVRAGFTLSLVYAAEVPFGTARRDARRLSQKLFHQDSEQELPPTQGGEKPSVAGPSSSAPAQALEAFEEAVLDGMDLPSPSPEHDPSRKPARVEDPSSIGQVPYASTPDRQDREHALHRATIASSRSESAPFPPDSAEDASVVFTIVLIPRSADIRLTGSLAEAAQEAVSILCQSRSWPQKDVHLDERYLCVTLQLPADRSPTGAVQELRRATSHTLLQRLPELSSHLPSRQFWNRRYLLQPGMQVDQRKIASMMEEAYA